MKIIISTLLLSVIFQSVGAQNKTSREEIGMHLFQTMQNLEKGKDEFYKRRATLQELKNFASIDTIPVR